MIRRREPEDAALCGGEGGDEGAEMGVVSVIRVLFDPFPVVVGAAEPETPGIALAVGALIIAGRVPGIGVEDGRPASGDGGDFCFIQIATVGGGDDAQWRLVRVDACGKKPEDDLGVAVV